MQNSLQGRQGGGGVGIENFSKALNFLSFLFVSFRTEIPLPTPFCPLLLGYLFEEDSLQSNSSTVYQGDPTEQDDSVQVLATLCVPRVGLLWV